MLYYTLGLIDLGEHAQFGKYDQLFVCVSIISSHLTKIEIPSIARVKHSQDLRYKLKWYMFSQSGPIEKIAQTQEILLASWQKNFFF